MKENQKAKVKVRNVINPKHEIINTKQYQSTNDKISKQNEFWYLNLEFRICLGFRP